MRKLARGYFSHTQRNAARDRQNAQSTNLMSFESDNLIHFWDERAMNGTNPWKQIFATRHSSQLRKEMQTKKMRRFWSIHASKNRNAKVTVIVTPAPYFRSFLHSFVPSHVSCRIFLLSCSLCPVHLSLRSIAHPCFQGSPPSITTHIKFTYVFRIQGVQLLLFLPPPPPPPPPASSQSGLHSSGWKFGLL